jgi:hypothetical protein
MKWGALWVAWVLAAGAVVAGVPRARLQELQAVAARLPGVDLTSGLANWWKLDDGAGTVVSDSVGGCDGGFDEYGENAWEAGRIGGALGFATGGTPVTFAGAPAALLGATNLSVGFWFCAYEGFSVPAAFFSAFNGSYYEDILVFTDGDGIAFQVNQGADGTGSIGLTIVPLEWVHVACVFDGTGGDNAARLKVYVNGAPQTVTFGAGYEVPGSTAPEAGHVFMLQAYPGVFGGVAGRMDDFRIYSRSLSDTEVRALFDATR